MPLFSPNRSLRSRARIRTTRAGRIAVSLPNTLEPVEALQHAWHITLAAMQAQGRISGEQAKRLRPLSKEALQFADIDPLPVLLRE